MIEQALHGFLSVFALDTLPFVLLGFPIGILVGLLPGIGGPAAIAMALPFVPMMGPGPALAFLVALHSVCATGGGVTSVLLNIPGEAFSAATCLDGFPMAKKGEAGRALGAVFGASGMGGIFGGVWLMGMIFVIRPLVMLVGLPEYFFLVLLGLSLIVTLGRGSIRKGLIAGLMGMFIAFFGVHVLTGEPRFWFGSYYLLKGFGIIPVVLGMFGMPVVIELFTEKESISQVERAYVQPGQVWEGIKDCFRHFRIFILGTMLGTVVGSIPGVGAQVVTFMSYGLAKQHSKHPELFGTGIVEGVIAPESADNAKEGGGLLSTLSLGVPGSVAMALLLGAFILVGLQPGPLFLKEHTDIVFELAGTLIFANFVAAALLSLVAGKLALVTYIRGMLVGPIVLILVIIGAYCQTSNMWDVIFGFAFGAIGYLMGMFGYNRAALVLGFILGDLAEKYFGLSVRTSGPLFFLKPFPLVLLTLTILILFSDQIKSLFERRIKNAR